MRANSWDWAEAEWGRLLRGYFVTGRACRPAEPTSRRPVRYRGRGAGRKLHVNTTRRETTTGAAATRGGPTVAAGAGSALDPGAAVANPTGADSSLTVRTSATSTPTPLASALALANASAAAFVRACRSTASRSLLKNSTGSAAVA